MTNLKLPPYERIALVLQGGGALGAYQAGVYQGLHEAGIELTCLSGISIGALNTAIIAGSPSHLRIERLTEFWETICEPNFGLGLDPFTEQTLFNTTDFARQALSTLHAGNALIAGQKGFFQPRFPPPDTPFSASKPENASYYDTRPLQHTLDKLCDYDLINDKKHRISVGAVNIQTGNFVYFDNAHTRLDARHFMASGALPPAFAPVEIEGEYFWDGGLVSNTPLTQVLDARPKLDTLVFQVDLWSARGALPTSMSEVSDRMKDIRFSSRTRMVTEEMREIQSLRHLLQHLLEELPEEKLRTDAYCKLACDLADNKHYNIIHLIYRNKPYERHFKDFQFGLATMREHWQSGFDDIRATLAKPGRLAMPRNKSGFITHDVHREEIEQIMNGDDNG